MSDEKKFRFFHRLAERREKKDRTSQLLDSDSIDKLKGFLASSPLTEKEFSNFLETASKQSVKDFVALLEDMKKSGPFLVLEEGKDGQRLHFRTNKQKARGEARYLVLATSGTGGFSEVKIAFDLKLGRLVALKEVDNFTREKKHADYLRSEAQHLAKFHSDYILTVHDFREVVDPDAGGKFATIMVMEYMNRRESYQLSALQQGSFIPPEDIQLLIDCLQKALEPYHKEDIYHLDIKPDNIWRFNERIYKLADFGAARDSQPLPVDRVIGTIVYMSPEVLRNEKLSPATEVYTIGLNALFSMSGEHFFEDINLSPPEIGRRIALFNPHVVAGDLGEISDVVESYCQKIEQESGKKLNFKNLLLVFQKALAQKQEDRYQSVGEFARALRKAWN